MKTILSILIIGSLSMGCVLAQELDEPDKYNKEQVNTLFKKDKRDGFYLSLSSGYSKIDNKEGLTFSSRACFIMDHAFAIGFAGTGFANNLKELDRWYNMDAGNTSWTLAGGYGGLVFEPILFGLKPVHLSFPVMVGVGAAAAFDYHYSSYYSTIEDMFFVAEPMVELEVNFTRFMRIAAFASYRFTLDLEMENISKKALNTPSFGATLKFGLF